MVVPVTIRKDLSEAGEQVLVLQRNLHRNCINLYTKVRWVKMLSDFQTLYADLSAEESDNIREFNRGTAEVEPDDSSGRILLPRNMLDWIGAGDEVILAGQGTKCEIWERRQYEEIAFSPASRARMAEGMYKRLGGAL
jgi:MraZ protein